VPPPPPSSTEPPDPDVPLPAEFEPPVPLDEPTVDVPTTVEPAFEPTPEQPAAPKASSAATATIAFHFLDTIASIPQSIDGFGTGHETSTRKRKRAIVPSCLEISIDTRLA
jgi:hypothetical protein